MVGYIDSIETMGLVDGPGIRMVVFMQGCKLRCLFCHNPETWTLANSNTITSDEIVEKLVNNMGYYTNGGITFSGGEPLIQVDFLIDCLKKINKLGIHTAIDTAGVGVGKYDEVLKYTDLVILDIKALDDESYYNMTGQHIDEFNNFVQCLNKSGNDVWIRQVIIPGINDNSDYIRKLKKYIKKINNIKKIELLPYHLYGVDKYKKLNLIYHLDGIPPMDGDRLKKLDKLLREE